MEYNIGNSRSNKPEQISIPFAVGRHDVSASLLGSKEDTRFSTGQPRKTLTVQQLQALITVFQKYKNQMEATAKTIEELVEQLMEFSDSIPNATINDDSLIKSLDFFIDSSTLLANAHGNWADVLERDVKIPMINGFTAIPLMAKEIQSKNQLKIDHMIKTLKEEELACYKLKKKFFKDKEAIKKSEHIQSRLSQEIQRAKAMNDAVPNNLAHDQVPNILNLLAKAVNAQLETAETISEGFQKMGSESASRSLKHIPSETEQSFLKQAKSMGLLYNPLVEQQPYLGNNQETYQIPPNHLFHHQPISPPLSNKPSSEMVAAQSDTDLFPANDEFNMEFINKLLKDF